MIYVDTSHPALVGCRYFGYPVAVAPAGVTPYWDLMGLLTASGGTGGEGGLDAPLTWGRTQSPHPTIAFNGTNSFYYNYWNRVWPTGLSNDFTVIARVKPTADALMGIISARNGDNKTGGFVFGFDNNGFCDGYFLIIYGGGQQLVNTTDGGPGHAASVGVERVVAAVYRSRERTVEIYLDGKLTASATSSAQNWTPYESTEQVLFVGRYNSGGVWQGNIGWFAIYNRALGSGEIAEWAADANWPWVDEPAMFTNAPLSGAYTTTVTVDSAETALTTGTVYYSNSTDADTIVDGDISSSPAPPGTGNYVTTVSVGSVEYMNFPQFQAYTTTVGVGSAETNTAPVGYTTTVLVGQTEAGLVDGRADLIGTERYRR